MIIVTAPMGEKISRIQEALDVMWEGYSGIRPIPTERRKELGRYCFQINDLRSKEDVRALLAELYTRFDEERYFVIVAMDATSAYNLLPCVEEVEIIELPMAVYIPSISRISLINRRESIIEALFKLVPPVSH